MLRFYFLVHLDFHIDQCQRYKELRAYLSSFLNLSLIISLKFAGEAVLLTLSMKELACSLLGWTLRGLRYADFEARFRPRLRFFYNGGCGLRRMQLLMLGCGILYFHGWLLWCGLLAGLEEELSLEVHELLI